METVVTATGSLPISLLLGPSCTSGELVAIGGVVRQTEKGQTITPPGGRPVDTSEQMHVSRSKRRYGEVQAEKVQVFSSLVVSFF